jgi:hypothetical protein
MSWNFTDGAIIQVFILYQGTDASGVDPEPGDDDVNDTDLDHDRNWEVPPPDPPGTPSHQNSRVRRPDTASKPPSAARGCAAVRGSRSRGRSRGRSAAMTPRNQPVNMSVVDLGARIYRSWARIHPLPTNPRSP